MNVSKTAFVLILTTCPNWMRVTDRGFCYSKLTLLSYFSPLRNIYLNKFTLITIRLFVLFFAFLPQLFFVEYLRLLLSFCLIPWLIFPT